MREMIDKVKYILNTEFEIIKRKDLHTSRVSPKRWIVERVFEWIETNGRKSKNSEGLNGTAAAMIHLFAIKNYVELLLDSFLVFSFKNN